ncbi:MAG: prephenate dehydrogenase/arogenate dehydrogenase family protein [Alicyclobacillus macrosporangiidus]|uniref:prephenate dehydrogenase n=1 Tax=Alicyclobacillus macrosporangiidus TaxID=392015 RepID=UPI0026EE6847|nr:prephenate dehydrogenase/arogenate dehydrogenase family protein [Alicyclobacillus macrosporangiidus]MCL6598941.1 prephenate dehydrogenase/arogenate dehydrogenase family protein [Alicyclobacillus macrosporangiidus]
MNGGVGARPATVLVVGCGLIGTSLALALHRARPGLVVHGVERSDVHRRQALATGAFAEVFPALPDLAETERGGRYELAVLAVPVDAACALLPATARLADVVMDVCSVKRPLVEAAEAAGLKAVFAPTHPMAGTADSGPAHARADLFDGRTWIVLDGWPACDAVTPWLEGTGARRVRLPSANDHDAAMASVSHGVHLASLSAMLAYCRTAGGRAGDWAMLAGPGFRDVTRLSRSGPDFWGPTLTANRDYVTVYLRALAEELNAFARALEEADGDALHQRLTEARMARLAWEEKVNHGGETTP